MPRYSRISNAAKHGAALALLLAATACSDSALGVKNLSSPDVERVLATPSSVEQTLSTGYQGCHNGTLGDLAPQTMALALESYSQLGNFNMGVRGGIPRTPIQNTRGSSTGVFTEFSALSRGGRLAVNALNALDKLIAQDTITPLDGVLGSKAADLRARSFGFFVIGCQSGWLAMFYDSAGVVKPGMASDVVPPLSPAAAVMDTALMMLDSAVTIAGNAAATATGGFPTPISWLGGTAYSRDDFVRIVRSYRARFRAGVVRSPTEAATVDWVKVGDDAENGIRSNFMVSVGGTTGWSIGFVSSQAHVEAAWSQMSLMYFGMADTSGAYRTWLGQSLTTRVPFLVVTPDLRWPRGTTRPEQQASSSTEPTGITSKPYIRNRSSADSPGDAWGVSFYDFYRLKYIRNASSTGLFPEITKAEIDLLAAEAYIRQGRFAEAAAKIDLTRVPNGLPSVVGITSLATPVPGGQACVPQVPVPSGGTQCGNIMEAMKYEKRMETAFTSVARWWLDARRWGDLIEATATAYPVPIEELDARYGASGSRPYTTGGGSTNSAAKGTYGF